MIRKILPLAIAAAAPLLAMGSGAHAQQPSDPQASDVQASDPQGSDPQMQGQQAPGQQAAPGQQPSGQQASTTSTCQFNSGSRNGSTVDFSATPGVAPVPIGSRCGDMTGSTGVAVHQGTNRMPGQGRFYRTPSAPVGLDPSGQPMAGYTFTCRFTSGPNAGSSHDFSGQLGATPIRIGSACSDGQNKGVSIAAGNQGSQGR
jgi:hypothetical protein